MFAPNPIFERKDFKYFNDGWLFSIDGITYQNINVPFCPQSELSGIKHKGFIRRCFYKKEFDFSSFTKENRRTVINFGAIDYKCDVFVNGSFVGSHTGGYTPFSFDISQYLVLGKNEILLLVFDDVLSSYPTGKQSRKEESYGCFYTRTTGIWQSVWIEYVPENYIEKVYFYPDVDRGAVSADLYVCGKGDYSIEVFYDNRLVGSACGETDFHVKTNISLSEKVLWEIGKGNLYSVKLTFCDDTVYSYFGLRKVEYKGTDFMLNGKPVYQKLILDQGYNPKGIYTSPSPEFMQRDINLSLDLGFNGARLHQKVFEPYFLYLCDKSGYMVWGEFASWGIDYSDFGNTGEFIRQWAEVLNRDFNHPSIITWCPLNEVWYDIYAPQKEPDMRIIESIFDFTKRFDTTRPCVDVSGGFHGENTDLYDFHSYRSVEEIDKTLSKLQNDNELYEPLLYNERNNTELRYKAGLPVNLSECGGIMLGDKINTITVNEGAVQNTDNWGYGKGETDGESFVIRYKALMETIMKYPILSGFCYTQLYDVEQEQNGFYTYDRKDKLTVKQKNTIKRINTRK